MIGSKVQFDSVCDSEESMSHLLNLPVMGSVTRGTSPRGQGNAGQQQPSLFFNTSVSPVLTAEL